jgi:hypothetical protein
MTEQQLLTLIQQQNITDQTNVVMTISDDDSTTNRICRIHFFAGNNSPAISNGRLGISAQVASNMDVFMPVQDGVAIDSIVSIRS